MMADVYSLQEDPISKISYLNNPNEEIFSIENFENYDTIRISSKIDKLNIEDGNRRIELKNAYFLNFSKYYRKYNNTAERDLYQCDHKSLIFADMKERRYKIKIRSSSGGIQELNSQTTKRIFAAYIISLKKSFNINEIKAEKLDINKVYEVESLGNMIEYKSY